MVGYLRVDVKTITSYKPRPSRPALGPMQSRIEWVMCLSRK